jgi:hypothetical protein
MSQSKIQRDAAALMAKAVEMLAQAQGQLRLANRFPVEPEVGTVLMFEKEFPTSQAALESAGLDFDPNKLVPNVRPAQLERLAEVMGVGRTGSVVVLDEDTFAEVQRTTYTYAALRIGGVWYTTAARGNKTMSWDKLVEFIGDARCWVAETWREIPVEAPEVIESASAEDEGAEAEAATLAGLLGANRKQVMETLQKLRANGKNPTPKTIVDALAKIGVEDK